ncbi:hypothetical protein NIE88_10865 [Sporolactobacillus shoreicorticis]|uniref:CAP domain-containing protein n=1 Tax=Sporolactobacillus shoreicorticis TaxID=1923877 RepID=A0ABW5S770_9BACL|nr:hypothetical protein [Sporolactobacillus shoreicorticis]MCO7126276.1 hypothetical protein [Sporolactobacillus shoreicorticis]
MKLPVSFKEHRALFRILSIGLLAVFVLYIGIWHPVSAKKDTHSQVVDRQISPVDRQERELFAIINKQRKKHHFQVLKADWNLFRVARIEAKRIASGRAEHTGNAGTMLRSLGYSESAAQMILLHTDNSDEQIRTLWQNSRQAASINSNTAGRRIGIGYATGEKGRIWIVFLADESSSSD